MFLCNTKGILFEGPKASPRAMYVPDYSRCNWNLDSGFQALVGFPIPLVVFRIQQNFPRIPDSTSKHFRDSGLGCGVHLS